MSEENDISLVELAADLSEHLSRQLRRCRSCKRQLELLRAEVDGYRAQAMELSAEVQMLRCQLGISQQ